MLDTAAPVDKKAEGRAGVQTPLAPALKEAGIAFAVALALFGSLVGFKTEGSLELTYHFGKAVLFAAVVAGARFLADTIFWRQADGGRMAATLSRFFRRLKWPALFLSLFAGFLLYAVGGLRSGLIESANGVSWLAGTLTDLATFACIAFFVIAAIMALTRMGRIVIKRTPLASLPYELSESFNRELPAALLVAGVLFPFLISGPAQRYAVDTGTQILIYIMLGWGLNVVVGLAGLLDLGYVAFYAVGAYTYALISTQYGWPFWACLPVAGVLAALWGMTLGFPVLRLRGDYLAIVTLAFGEIIRIVLINWESLTGGPNGINRIPRPSFFGLPFDRSPDWSFHSFFGLAFDPVHRIIFLYYLILALALATNFVTLRLRRLPIGRAWEALREDEIACRSLGINTVTAKLTAFAIGAMFGGFAGAFFAARQGFISPESFTFNESALVLAVVVLGGLGSQLGVVIAAVVLVGSAERFRELQDYRMLIFGLAMVLVMIWRPRGLMPGRTPSASLRETRTVQAGFIGQGRG